MPRSLVQLAVQGQIRPKLGKLSMNESTCNLNPLEQGTIWVRMHNVYVTNKHCTILPYNGEKTVKVKCLERTSVWSWDHVHVILGICVTWGPIKHFASTLLCSSAVFKLWELIEDAQNICYISSFLYRQKNIEWWKIQHFGLWSENSYITCGSCLTLEFCDLCPCLRLQTIQVLYRNRKQMRKTVWQATKTIYNNCHYKTLREGCSRL